MLHLPSAHELSSCIGPHCDRLILMSLSVPAKSVRLLELQAHTIVPSNHATYQYQQGRRHDLTTTDGWNDQEVWVGSFWSLSMGKRPTRSPILVCR
ncbi:hypothetical protein Ae201684P_011450 [Aphanomyces euteiches]|uniref:Uncharacterized protein n=1 Tax=Aphanomyces euteiches TaxID=100861 RepID=A0A6G0XYK3_9STRA|nr:hypothetical protein Ae201684_000088 [Aphanomyces euteiches]KAH9091908.1 hypothetical protein Ae201684P_011450 [Aphanomyces euteiches]